MKTETNERIMKGIIQVRDYGIGYRMEVLSS